MASHIDKFVHIQDFDIRKSCIKMIRPTIFVSLKEKYGITLYFSCTDLSKCMVFKMQTKKEQSTMLDYIKHCLND